MADPFSISAVGAGASAGGSILSAIGAISGGESQQAMYQYQAGVAQLNQKIALQNADYAEQVGGTAVLQEGRKVASVVSAEKVGQAGSGIDVNTGSAAETRASTTRIGQYDEGVIATNYAKKAYGYEVEAATKGAEAGADIIAGDEAVKASKIAAASSILSGAGNVASKWLQGSTTFGKADQTLGA